MAACTVKKTDGLSELMGSCGDGGKEGKGKRKRRGI